MLGAYPNLHLDTTMVIGGYFARQPDLAILRRHPDRILYGTDFPNIPYGWDRELRALRAMKLPRRTRRRSSPATRWRCSAADRLSSAAPTGRSRRDQRSMPPRERERVPNPASSQEGGGAQRAHAVMAVTDDLRARRRLHLLEARGKLVQRDQRLRGQPRQLVLPFVAHVEEPDAARRGAASRRAAPARSPSASAPGQLVASASPARSVRRR